MRKHIILFFSALLFLYACKENGDASGIIKRDVMTRLLVDVHIVDGSLSYQPSGDSLYANGTGKYLYLFKQYHTDSAQFKKSIKYYSLHPDVLVKMYQDITKSLQDKSDSLNKILAKETEAATKRTIAQQTNKDKIRLDSIEAKKKMVIEAAKLDSIKKAHEAKPLELKKKKKKHKKKHLLLTK